jgi:malonyl-CoA/methylmalonyl-CoA synthetase
VPLNPAYTGAETETLVADCQPALFVCDDARKGDSSPGAPTLSLEGEGGLLARAAGTPAITRAADRSPGDLAAILYTSGTTGRAKGAMLTQGNLVSNARTLFRAWGFSEADVLLHALPIFHVHGLFVATHVAMAAGASLIFQPRFDVDAVIAALPGATSFMGVPTYYTRLLADARFTAEAAAGIRLFVSGSAPLLPATFAAFEARTGQRILERYGMTETLMNTSNPLEGERRPGTVGPALPGISVRVAHPETGTPLEAGAVGVVEVSGPNVFSGYWRRPELKASEFRSDGFFITGDLGRLDADGYLEIVGRAKDLVISGGLNIYPKEVETVIDGLPGVLESAVFGVPHADFGEAVMAAIVALPGATLTAETVRAALSERLAPYKLPKRIVILPALPRNTMGKVQKAALRREYETCMQ